MPPSFAVTWDYRCPFARNAHEHILAGLRAGADWDVRFVPFSLDQVHVEEGEPDVWDREKPTPGMPAMLAGIVVRDRSPEQFLTAHAALFRARHDHGRDLRDPAAVEAVLREVGIDVDAVRTEIESGWPLDVFRKEHEAAARDNQVWGVPTFISGDDAVFVRLMTRPGEDGASAVRTIERVLDLLAGFPELNEYKHTSLRR